MATKMVKISSIVVGKRYRSKLGDLTSLQDSIEKHGLLQPIGVDTSNTLIFGQRRLEAHKKLGRLEIEVKVFDLDDLELLQVEQSENADREPMSDDDKLDLGRAIRSRIKERRGNPELNVFDQNTQEPASSSNSGQLSGIGNDPKKGQETREHVAKASGFKNAKEMERKEKVRDKSPAPVWEAVKSDVVSASDAAAIADEPADKQLQALERVKSGEAKTLQAGLVEPKQTQKARAAVRAAKNHQPASEDSEPELDICGRPIPAHLSKVIATSKAICEYTRLLTELQKMLIDMKGDQYQAGRMNMSSINLCKNLKHAIEVSIFHCLCVYCDGVGKKGEAICKACCGCGWIDKDTYISSPPEKRKVS